MKATVIKAIAVVVVVIASVMNTNVYAGNKYVVNYETVGEQIVSRTVYRNDGSLTRHAKYNYAYNEQGQMIEQVTYKWDSDSQAWKPCHKATFTYADNGTASTVEYKKSEKSTEWILVQNINFSQPTILMADSGK